MLIIWIVCYKNTHLNNFITLGTTYIKKIKKLDAFFSDETRNGTRHDNTIEIIYKVTRHTYTNYLFKKNTQKLLRVVTNTRKAQKIIEHMSYKRLKKYIWNWNFSTIRRCKS